MPELKGRRPADPDEYYATTPELAELCCQTLRKHFIARPRTVLDPASVLEPTCGAGTWLPGIRRTWPAAHLHAVERHPALAGYARGRGFSVETQDVFRAELRTYDLIVGNPPFSVADDLIPLLLGRLNPGGVLAFLLRLNFFEGGARYEKLWRIFPAAAAYPLPDRPGFTEDGGTDGTGYMMCCWQQGYEGPTVLSHLDNRFIENRWSQGRREVKDRQTGEVVRPMVPDPRFPDPRNARVVQPVAPAVAVRTRQVVLA
jgi:hypothetical protein